MMVSDVFVEILFSPYSTPTEDETNADMLPSSGMAFVWTTTMVIHESAVTMIIADKTRLVLPLPSFSENALFQNGRLQLSLSVIIFHPLLTSFVNELR